MGNEARRLEPLSIDQADRSAAGEATAFSLLLAIEFLIVLVLRIPYDLGFTAFAFADRGSWLTVSDLATHGMRPVVDFGYEYGLLPIWLSAGWFGALGNNPRAFEAASLLCGLTMVAAIARIARALGLPKPARWLAIIALPFAVITTYPSMAHAVEAALLCNALAEQACGRRTNALALATAACFTKPSMGYVYGFVLILFGIHELYRRGDLDRGRINWAAIGRMITPAAATAGVLAAILGFAYGPRSLVLTLFPLAGIRDYAALNFGFFHGIGSYFWRGTPIRFYLLSVVGFWIVASIWLLAAGLVSLWRVISGADEASRARQEFVATTAAMHTLFVTAFFAGPMSWSFYSYVLVLGAMASCTTERLARFVVVALVVMAVTGQTGFRARDIRNWRELHPAAATAGLWATAGERNALIQTVAALHGQRAEFISAQGATPLLFPSSFERNDYAYLLPGITSNTQFAGVIAKIGAASRVVAVVAPEYGDGLNFWPQIKIILARRQLVLKNGFYAVYRPHDMLANEQRGEKLNGGGMRPRR